MNVALIVAGGVGSRITSNVPKQFIKINGKELICYTLDKFEEHNSIDDIVIVSLKEWIPYLEELIKNYNYTKVVKIIEGGSSRQESVRNGLNEISYNENDIILIHDADRPFIDTDSIDRLLTVTNETGNAVLAVKNNDLMPGTSQSGRVAVYNNLEYSIQTPQCFMYGKIKELHNRLKDCNVSDDATLYDITNLKVNIVEGRKENIKVTTDLDMDYLFSKLGK